MACVVAENSQPCSTKRSDWAPLCLDMPGLDLGKRLPSLVAFEKSLKQIGKVEHGLPRWDFLTWIRGLAAYVSPYLSAWKLFRLPRRYRGLTCRSRGARRPLICFGSPRNAVSRRERILKVHRADFLPWTKVENLLRFFFLAVFCITHGSYHLGLTQ